MSAASLLLRIHYKKLKKKKKKKNKGEREGGKKKQRGRRKSRAFSFLLSLSLSLSLSAFDPVLLPLVLFSIQSITKAKLVGGRGSGLLYLKKKRISVSHFSVFVSGLVLWGFQFMKLSSELGSALFVELGGKKGKRVLFVFCFFSFFLLIALCFKG